MQNKAKITSEDLTKERLDKLKELLPELFSSDGNLNIQNLYDLANQYSSAKKEKYEFNWAGKLECQKLALEPTKSCLLPNFDKSINFDKTQNIIIEGDNLEVLKTLYQPYFEKIKCIYIDPPYNTGNDFIYDDKRQEGKKAYWQRNGITHEGVKLETNPEATGKKHSLWCSFIYPRLMLARNLLSKDGVIFVSIDDNEVHNLRKMMDEVFGEENFVGCIAVSGNPRGRDYGGIARMHDYLMVYSKTEDDCLINNLLDDDKNFPFSDAIGGFEVRELRNRNIAFNITNRPNLHYPFYINPNNCDENEFFEISLEKKADWVELFPKESQGYKTVWRWGKPKSGENLNKNIVGKSMQDGGWQVVEKYREKTRMARSIWYDKDVNTEKGTLLLKEIFDSKLFSFPKPMEMIRRIIEMGSFQNSQILDFFAGSGTTAHATLKLNAEEKIRYAKENHPKLEKGEISKEDYLQGLDETGSRKFILTQLPEYTDEKSEAFKAGYKTISAICIERVKRAGQKIIEEIKLQKDLNNEAKEQIITSLDIGFKTYQLKDTNIDKAYYEMENPAILEEYLKNSQALKLFDDEKINLLYEIAIKNGFDLSVNFKKIDAIKDNEVYQVNAGNRESALICVDQDIKLDSINQIYEETSKENRSWQFFCFDNALSITVKTNLKSKVRAVVI